MAEQTSVLELQKRWGRTTALKNALRIAKRKYTGTASAAVVAALIFMAVFAPIVAPYDPLEVHTESAFQGPQLSYPFGTDELGRDILSRVIYGARISLIVGIGAATLGMAGGMIIGLTSAYMGGLYDLFIQRFIDSLQAFPSLVLAMALVATLGASTFNVILAISMTMIASRARVLRGSALSIMQNDYVLAARVIGASGPRIMLHYVLPNVWAPIIVLVSASLGVAIIAEASLSFLGLGSPPPHPTWGGMLSGSARNYMLIAPWLAFAPGIAITVVVLAFNLLGDAIRDILDPRLRGT